MDEQKCNLYMQWNIIPHKKEWNSDTYYTMDKPWK